MNPHKIQVGQYMNIKHATNSIAQAKAYSKNACCSVYPKNCFLFAASVCMRRDSVQAKSPKEQNTDPKKALNGYAPDIAQYTHWIVPTARRKTRKRSINRCLLEVRPLYPFRKAWTTCAKDASDVLLLTFDEGISGQQTIVTRNTNYKPNYIYTIISTVYFKTNYSQYVCQLFFA